MIWNTEIIFFTQFPPAFCLHTKAARKIISHAYNYKTKRGKRGGQLKQIFMPFLVMAPFLVLVGSFLGFIVMVISTLFFKTRPQKSAIARRSWIILAPLRKSSNCKILHISFFGIEVRFQQNPGLIGSKHETFPQKTFAMTSRKMYFWAFKNSSLYFSSFLEQECEFVQTEHSWNVRL